MTRRDRQLICVVHDQTQQKFASVHASIHNHFNQERHLVDRQIYKERQVRSLPSTASASPQ